MPFPCSNPAKYDHPVGFIKLLTTSYKALYDLATSYHSDLSSSFSPLVFIREATQNPCFLNISRLLVLGPSVVLYESDSRNNLFVLTLASKGKIFKDTYM